MDLVRQLQEAERCRRHLRVQFQRAWELVRTYTPTFRLMSLDDLLKSAGVGDHLTPDEYTKVLKTLQPLFDDVWLAGIERAWTDSHRT